MKKDGACFFGGVWSEWSKLGYKGPKMNQIFQKSGFLSKGISRLFFARIQKVSIGDLSWKLSETPFRMENPSDSKWPIVTPNHSF